MKINEVEQLVGVTKRNIRFYEKEGLLSPGRTDNGYRDYSEADVEALRKIKLLRKLDVPLEEIRRMQQGTLTLTDGVRRHIIQLERAQDNLATMRSLCQELAESGEQLASLDAGRWLEKMERMEEGGTQFMNIRKNDIVTRYGGTVAAALVFVALMGGEIESYTQMLTEARQIATKRMVDDAEAMGADAVIGIRYTSASVMQGAAEITAYGTAVRIAGEA